MNRRSFLASVVAVASASILKGYSFGQVAAPANAPATTPATGSVTGPETGPALAQQAEMIRTAASRFLQMLSPELRKRVLLDFPKGESPTAVGFSAMPGRLAGGAGGVRHDVSFDTNGTPKSDSDHDQNHGPGGGPHGGPGGGPHGFDGHHGGPPAAGEEFGQAVWTNFPVSIVARPGVQMGELSVTQRDAVHALLNVVLSPMGYQKVQDIMAGDQKVADAGADYAAGFDVYTIALLGEPSATEPWMLQFGGHHLGLNVVFVGNKAVCAPLHTGILPARFTADGKIIRGLGRENDKAFDLLATFSPQQLKSAIIEHNVSDLLCGPGRPSVKFAQAGLRGSDMTPVQQAMLVGLAQEWVGVLNSVHTAARLEEIRALLADTYFAWSGSIQHDAGINGESYFRIHGPTLLIEHAPQGNQGGYKVHVHTVMRDISNDYGKRFLA